jgi:Tfp pilus assembly pilus retraction ATPase PilT
MNLVWTAPQENIGILLINQSTHCSVTGPTGSGKTTTLYTSLKKMATLRGRTSALEDPIEMVEPSFNRCVNHIDWILRAAYLCYIVIQISSW